jgi:hypothetical protein
MNAPGWQVKSRISVSPTEVIKVSFSDYEKLGGIIEWTTE